MRTAGIREFRQHLGLFLREVRTGETILITDRGQVVAEVKPPGAADRSVTATGARLQRAVVAGLVRPALRPAKERRDTWREFHGLGLPAGSAKALLDAERDE